ncbi:MAG: ribosome biogenesis GTP-binding protein YihA/YsxC [bacterium]
MIIKSALFVKSVSAIKDLPNGGLLEFAFIGRSNVGKSSIMNLLLGRKNLVKTSKKPGKTALLNYFLVNDSFFFVDLPGYGFASKSKSELEMWRTLIELYLVKRKELLTVFLLVDSRRDFMEIDRQMIDFLHYHGLKYVTVFTKTDKLNKTEQNLLKQRNPNSFFSSITTGDGKGQLLEYISGIVQNEGQS